MSNYIVRQGVKVAPGTYLAYSSMRTAFRNATGLDLLITSGYRTYAEQKSLYDRWKAGTFFAPSVARPGTSRHENGRALDLRDSGNSPGVTVAGNSRSNWLRANAHRFGFSPEGYKFSEPWHYEYQGNPWTTPSLNHSGFGSDYIKTIQKYLIGLGYSVGSSGVDGSLGPATISAVKSFQKDARLTQDGSPGPQTLAALQIRSTGSKLDVDGRFGPASTRKLQSVLGTTIDGVISGQSEQNRKFVPAVSTISIGRGGSQVIHRLQSRIGKLSLDGHLGRATIARWQQNLKVTNDGYLGPNTAKAIQKALNQNKLW